MQKHQSLEPVVIEHQNLASRDIAPCYELYLSYGEEVANLKYKNAKWQDVEIEIAFFVFNKREGSDKFGRCFGVTNNGVVWAQMDLPYNYDDTIVQHTWSDALNYVSDHPLNSFRALIPLLIENGCNVSLDLLVMTPTELKEAIDDGCYQHVVEAETDGTICWDLAETREKEPIHEVKKGERFWVWDFVDTDTIYTHEYSTGKPVTISTDVKLKLIYATQDPNDALLKSCELDKSPNIS